MYQEYQKHIFSETETAKSQAISTAAEAVQKKMVADYFIKEKFENEHCPAKTTARSYLPPDLTAQQEKALDALCDTNLTPQEILVWVDKNFPERRSLCSEGQIYSHGACRPLTP